MGIRAELEVVGKKGGEEEEVLRLFVSKGFIMGGSQ